MVTFFFSNDKVIKILIRSQRRALGGKLRPYAGIVGHKSTGIHSREVLFDLSNGLVQPRGVWRQIARIVYPLDVWAETDPPSQVKGEVRAESACAGLRGGVYKAGDFGLRSRVGEVVALCVEELLVLRGRDNHVVDGDGAEAGGVDERFGGDGGDVAV